jgi:rare lipoprotein A
MKNVLLYSTLTLSLLLVACGGGTAVKPTPAPGASAADKPVTPPKKGGGYYLDDGPGDNPPADIDAIADAMPRAEAPLPRANRPYSALGNRYTPMTEYAPYKQRGIASWYGKRYHGQKTSSGEVYDMYGMTAAHTTLPLPSYARVTNPENGRSVIVRINDRGPFHSDRLIDLSYAAAYKLRIVGKGSGLVEVEAIDPRGELFKPKNAAQPLATSSTPAPLVVPPPIDPPTELQAPPPEPIQTAQTPHTATSIAPGNYVQVGAFKFKDNSDKLTERLRQQNLAENVAVESWYNAGTYRVRLGPYSSRADAERAAVRIKQALKVNAIVLDLK